jgi:hypothetical protein
MIGHAEVQLNACNLSDAVRLPSGRRHVRCVQIRSAAGGRRPFCALFVSRASEGVLVNCMSMYDCATCSPGLLDTISA